MQKTTLRKKTVAYSEEGNGKVIVFLHGFTESSAIWKNYSRQLSAMYRVICIDLPGHGKSSRIGNVHTMEMMAEAVYGTLKKAGVSKCVMIGHSMGGYVTLAFARKYPSMLKGFGLFHSHCYADSPQDARNRELTIELVNMDKLGFVAQFIPGLFPVQVQKKFASEITKLTQKAARMEKESVIAALEGMKIRSDHTAFLKETTLPVLFILGLLDPKAPVDRFWEMISLPEKSHVLLLKTCGHMGFIEAPDECLGAIRGFVRNYL